MTEERPVFKVGDIIYWHSNESYLCLLKGIGGDRFGVDKGRSWYSPRTGIVRSDNTGTKWANGAHTSVSEIRHATPEERAIFLKAALIAGILE